MKKTKKLLSLLMLVGLAITGCDKDEEKPADSNPDGTNNYGENSGNSDNGGTPTYVYDANKAAWSDTEKKIFADYLYNAEVPYKNIDQETELSYKEDYETAVKTAPVSDATLLSQYAKLFDETWDNYNYFNDEGDGAFYYCYEKGFETEAGTRYVDVRFYGGEYDEQYDDYSPTEDGSGTFVLEVFDPYTYEFPAELTAEVIKEFELESPIPSIDAEYFEIDDTYLFLGICYFSIYAHGDTALLETYAKALVDAGFEKYGTEEGFDCYKTTAEDISIDIKYYDEYRVLSIQVYMMDKLLEGDSLTEESFGMSGDSAYKEYTAVGESGAEYSGKISNAAAIQLRTKNSDCGIVVTKSAGIVAAVALVWNEITQSNRSVQVYASNEPFKITDMFDSSNDAVELVATLEFPESLYSEYEFKEEYAYIGFRSSSGALNLDEIIIAWDNGEAEELEEPAASVEE